MVFYGSLLVEVITKNNIPLDILFLFLLNKITNNLIIDVKKNLSKTYMQCIYVLDIFMILRRNLIMKIIAVANQKGGVAKTTSTYNLAAVKAIAGKKVLMIDLDSQASLTIACGLEPGDERFEGHSVIDLFDRNADPADAVFKVDNPVFNDNLYVIPSLPDFALTDVHINSLDEKVYFLKDACEVLKEYEFDYIFLDCPPNLGIIVTNALIAATDIIIPVRADYLSYRGLQLICDSIDKVKSNKRMNPDLNILGILLTFYRSNVNDNKSILNVLNKQWEGQVLGIIKQSVDIEKGVPDGVPAVVYNLKCETAQAYVEIAKKID